MVLSRHGSRPQFAELPAQAARTASTRRRQSSSGRLVPSRASMTRGSSASASSSRRSPAVPPGPHRPSRVPLLDDRSPAARLRARLEIGRVHREPEPASMRRQSPFGVLASDCQVPAYFKSGRPSNSLMRCSSSAIRVACGFNALTNSPCAVSNTAVSVFQVTAFEPNRCEELVHRRRWRRRSTSWCSSGMPRDPSNSPSYSHRAGLRPQIREPARDAHTKQISGE